MKKIITLLALVVLTSGCASVRYTRLIEEPAPKLNPTASVFVLVPENGTYYGKVYPRSGETMANVIRSIFLKHSKSVEVAPQGEKFEEGIKKAKDTGFNYLINSKLLHWADHATEWSGIRDRIDMNLDIFDTSSGKLLDSINFKGNGTWFTFGGYHPEHIVRKSIDEYVSSLFGHSER